MFSLFCAFPTFDSLSIFSLHLSGHARLSILLLYKRKGNIRNCHHVWLKHFMIVNCDCCRSIQTTVKIYNKNGCIYIDANKIFLGIVAAKMACKNKPDSFTWEGNLVCFIRQTDSSNIALPPPPTLHRLLVQCHQLRTAGLPPMCNHQQVL